MNKSPNSNSQGLIDKGFELGKGIDKVFIIGGIGVAAVGAVVAAPAVVAFGAATTAGSVVTKEITERFQKGYENLRNKNKLSIGKQAAKNTVNRS